MSTTPDPKDKEENTPGLKPESTADAEGQTTPPIPTDPTTDDGYEEKPESTEDAEGRE